MTQQPQTGPLLTLYLSAPTRTRGPLAQGELCLHCVYLSNKPEFG